MACMNTSDYTGVNHRGVGGTGPLFDEQYRDDQAQRTHQLPAVHPEKRVLLVRPKWPNGPRWPTEQSLLRPREC